MHPTERQFESGAYAAQPGASKPYYKDSDFAPCETCGSLGRTTPNLKGEPTFYHRVNTGEDSFGFTEAHRPKD